MNNSWPFHWGCLCHPDFKPAPFHLVKTYGNYHAAMQIHQHKSKTPKFTQAQLTSVLVSHYTINFHLTNKHANIYSIQANNLNFYHQKPYHTSCIGIYNLSVRRRQVYLTGTTRV